MSAVLADHLVRPARGDDHGQDGHRGCDRIVEVPARRGERRGWRGDDGGGLRNDGEPPSPAYFAARVAFLKEEVFEICGALALGESLLKHLGRPSEAAHLAAVFGVVEGRLVEPRPTTE
jgi:hypothetical protein